jgi:2-polyprenyl-3-methyl-5-hydroxy-6-metoxy-1,4-benzoquinol methylase
VRESTLFGNLVNRTDLAAAVRALTQPRWARRRLHVRSHDRVLSTWGSVRETSGHWYDVPLVVEHRRRRAGDGRWSDHVERFVATHLEGLGDLTALSVGCGTGEKELRWARSGVLAWLDAFDLTEALVDAAAAAAANAGLGDTTNFFVGDLFELPLGHERYDVIIFEDSLHHLSPMAEAIRRTDALLVPGGYVVVNEYVGPNRQQMTKRTRTVANGLLGAIPARYRRQTNGSVKQQITTASRLRMIVRDPSEAPESEAMLRFLGERFELLESTLLGGTLTYPLLDGIAQNFADEEGQSILGAILALEDALIEAGDVPSDYVFATYRKSGVLPEGRSAASAKPLEVA